MRELNQKEVNEVSGGCGLVTGVLSGLAAGAVTFFSAVYNLLNPKTSDSSAGSDSSSDSSSGSGSSS
ncbi:class IIb bacteriocin, lactobin A/cerein 7B family [Erwinia sp. CGal63]|uniref:class IIb bacteriocin, lactobin A/cerein 7B family n=1 Tax=Erwinia sp. CGal63 TaxID=2919889 RepID=UPI0030096EC8